MATYNKFQPWVEYLAEGVNCGSAITMANADTFTLTFDPTNGLFTVA